MIITLTGWDYDPVTGVVVIGQDHCPCTHFRSDAPAGRSYRFAWVPCKPCKGSGRRGSGKCSKCSYHRTTTVPDYMGPGTVPDYSTPIDDGPCRQCDGSLVVQGNGNASLPADILAAFYDAAPISLIHGDARLTRLESLMGLTVVDDPRIMVTSYGVLSDYGRTYQALADAQQAGTVAEFRLSMMLIGVSSLTDDRRNVCGWAVGRVPGDDYHRPYILPSRRVAMIGPDGVRFLGVREAAS